MVLSISALAQQLLELDYQVQGPLYFTYEGEKLTDRRDRMEKEIFQKAGRTPLLKMSQLVLGRQFILL